MGLSKGDKEVYNRALKHKSIDQKDNNERMEFLGDSIINSVVSTEIFKRNPEEKEGVLSIKRAKIVSRKHLNKLGKEMGLQTRIKSSFKFIPEKIYGNTLEAIVGAVYIDKGYEAAKRFVVSNILESKHVATRDFIDYKTKLNNKTLKSKSNVEYRLIRVAGPDHKKEFTIALFINNLKVSVAKAFSIKQAEQIAARKTLANAN